MGYKSKTFVDNKSIPVWMLRHRLALRCSASFQISEITVDVIGNKKSLIVIAFNCKNVKTSVQAINSLIKNNDIILLQEHWLFQCQIDSLGEICEKTHFCW